MRLNSLKVIVALEFFSFLPQQLFYDFFLLWGLLKCEVGEHEWQVANGTEAVLFM